MAPLGPLVALALAAAPRIAVMPITPGDAGSERSAAFLTETLAAEIRQQSGADVVTPRDLGNLLSLEKQKQVLGCASDSCMAELAGAVGAERLVSGDVARLGESLLLELRLLDARKARVVAQSRRRFRNGTYDDLLDALPGMVTEILRGTAPAPAEATARKTEPPRPPPAADQVVLHYRRDDARYGAVQLITWESFEASDELRRPQSSIIPDVAYNVPSAQAANVPRIAPTGTDGFGVYWSLPASRYRNGRVNFVVAVGGGFDECGGKMGRYWILQDGREAWHTAPACDVSTTRPQVEPAAARPDRPERSATASPAPVSAPRLSPPAGQVALHYHRADGRYAGVQLITWESFEQGEERRRPQSSILPANGYNVPSARAANVPLVAPSGTDAFGVYWLLPASTYRNGRVNFVVAAGTGFDECGGTRARSWIVQDGREAWHSAPACETLVDPEAALRSLRGR